MQPTLANFLTEQLTQRGDEIAYTLRVARLRQKLPAYFLRGTMLRPPDLGAPAVDVAMSRVSIYAARMGGATELERRVPAAIAGAWRSASGGVAIPIASIVDDSLTLSVRLDAAAYGFARGARVYRVDEAGRALVATLGAGNTTVPVRVPGRGALVLEMVGR